MEEAIHFVTTKGSAEKAESQKSGNGFRSSRSEKGKMRGCTWNWCERKSGRKNYHAGKWRGRGSNGQKLCSTKFAGEGWERERRESGREAITKQ